MSRTLAPLSPPQIAAFISDKIKDDAWKHVLVRPIRRRDREWHYPYP